MSPRLVAYVGLTHLGLVSAAAALEKGFKVLCLDPDEGLVARLKEGVYPIEEPGFVETLATHKERLTFSSDLNDLKSADLVYVAPDIPTDEKGASDFSGIKFLISMISPVLSQEACLVVLSQVSPGFTRSLQKNGALAGFSSAKVYYQVETLVFGIALSRALYPERFIIGAYNPPVSLDATFESFLKAFGCPLLVMDYESAEFCKICINAFLAASVSTTNMLEEICQKIGAKWQDIAPALRLDKRIGPYAYLAPGLGLAGGNIERDLATIQSLSQSTGTHGAVVTSFIQNSQYRKNWPLHVFYRQILPLFQEKVPDLAILGLAYKENTHSIKNSAAVRLISQLKGFPMQVYDPLVKGLSGVTHKGTALEAVEGADVLFVMTPWDAFKSLSLQDVLGRMNKKFIVDPYQLLGEERGIAMQDDLTYYSLC